MNTYKLNKKQVVTMEQVEKLTELAQKMLQVDDAERKYRAATNLQQKIVEDIGGVISACTDLIEENTTLRFSNYQSNISNMFGQFNTARKCINLLKDDYKEVVEYESDTEGKRAERKQKLEEYRQIVSIQLPPKKVIHHMGVKCYTEVIRDVSPDIIYCQHGTYRQYSEVCNTFEYRLCRKIQKNSNDELKTLFQKVCLYIALKNERAMMREELLLLGIDVPDDKKQPQKPNKGDVEAFTMPSELDSTKAKELFQRAIEAGLMTQTTNGYKWLYGGKRGNVRLAYFLQCVFNADKCSIVPYKKLEALFGVRNLAQTTDQMNNAKKPQQWKDEIKKFIFKHP